LIFLILYILINTLFNGKTYYYAYLISIYLGIFSAEYINYGNNIFKIKQKCYKNCNISNL